MKTKSMIFVLTVMLSLYCSCVHASVPFSRTTLAIDSIRSVDDIPDLFQWGDIYMGGQPNLETMKMLKEEGVDLVISLRSEKENNQFKMASFNEKKVAEGLIMSYLSVPVEGYNSYTPDNLKKFKEALNTPHKKVLIHCLSCGRVTQFIMAYLIQYKDYSIDEAIAVGKKLKHKSTLEMLLGKEISMSYK